MAYSELGAHHSIIGIWQYSRLERCDAWTRVVSWSPHTAIHFTNA